jgi:hypothetical protein
LILWSDLTTEGALKKSYSHFPFIFQLRFPQYANKCRQFKRLRIFTASFPSFGCGFDSHRPHQFSAKFPLIQLPLLTTHPLIRAKKRPGFSPMLRPSSGV